MSPTPKNPPPQGRPIKKIPPDTASDAGDGLEVLPPLSRGGPDVAGMEPHTDQQRKHANGNEETLGSQPEGNPQQDRAVEKRSIQLLTRSHGSTYLAITGAFRQRSISVDACLLVKRSGKAW